MTEITNKFILYETNEIVLVNNCSFWNRLISTANICEAPSPYEMKTCTAQSRSSPTSTPDFISSSLLDEFWNYTWTGTNTELGSIYEIIHTVWRNYG